MLIERIGWTRVM